MSTFSRHRLWIIGAVILVLLVTAQVVAIDYEQAYGLREAFGAGPRAYPPATCTDARTRLIDLHGLPPPPRQ